MRGTCSLYFFFFNDTATTEIYTLSLHDALPICFGVAQLQGAESAQELLQRADAMLYEAKHAGRDCVRVAGRSEEHTSELQSRLHLVCRLLLEKKKKQYQTKFTGDTP